MIIALFGADGRAIGTHAALVLARVAADAGTPVTLLRVTDGLESRLLRVVSLPDVLRIFEVSRDEASSTGVLAGATADRAAAGLTVLDLPPDWLPACPFELGRCPRVVAVGPSALECDIALSLLRGGTGATVPWLLACGEAEAGAFETAWREAVAARPGADAPEVRILPMGLPHRREDLGSPSRGWRPDARSVRGALQVLDAVAPGAVKARRRPRDLLASLLPGRGRGGGRGTQDRLRDLADALDAASEGGYPSAEDLAGAPVLEDWDFGLRPVEALVGRVAHHPDFPAGRHIRTSEVYASDRRTWARTYSRLYRLGRPSGPRATLQ
jgi:hypothetical protein